MINYLRNFIVHLKIQREQRNLFRTKKVVNLTEASTIGILFLMESEEDYDYINSLVLQLNTKGKAVSIIAYLPMKQIPNYYLAKLKMDILTSKDLNLLGICKKPFVESFIQKDFDLLIDLSAGDILPLNYISGYSHANFKTGCFTQKMVEVFDFMIKNTDGMESREFAETMVSYLRTINSK